MSTSRRGFLTTAGVAATQSVSHARDHSHDHQAVPSDPALRVKALESLLVEKGLVDRAALDALVDAYEHKIGPRNGARVVARAWVDAAYKQRLIADGTAAIAELGYTREQGWHMGGMHGPNRSREERTGVSRALGGANLRASPRDASVESV